MLLPMLYGREHYIDVMVSADRMAACVTCESRDTTAYYLASFSKKVFVSSSVSGRIVNEKVSSVGRLCLFFFFVTVSYRHQEAQ